MRFRILALLIPLAAVSCTAPISGPAGTSQVIEKAHIHVPKSVPAVPQQPMELPGIANFGFVSPDLWRGGEPTPEGLKTLAAMGAKTVIDLRESDESANIPTGIHYVRLPISSWHPDLMDVARVLQTIAASPKPVFIHCREGRDRTGLAIAAFRLSQGMTADDACTELRNFRVNFWWAGTLENRVRALARSSVPH